MPCNNCIQGPATHQTQSVFDRTLAHIIRHNECPIPLREDVLGGLSRIKSAGTQRLKVDGLIPQHSHDIYWLGQSVSHKARTW